MQETEESTQPSVPRRDRVAMFVAIFFPSLVTWAYFVAMDGQDSALQQASYAAGKCLQFGFPAFWVFKFARRKKLPSQHLRANAAIGIVFAVFVVVAGFVLFQVVLRPSGVFDSAAIAIQAKVLGMGVTTGWQYLVLATFYAVGHSLMEEYYWRWFVFAELRRCQTIPKAIVVSSVGFALHHVIVLAQFFGWTSWVTYTFSFGVAVGGAFWAWLYHRGNALVAPWLSHLVIDAGIFLIGYELIGRFQ